MPETVPTIAVKSLETGASSTINASDFDATIHEKVGGKERKTLKPGAIEQVAAKDTKSDKK